MHILEKPIHGDDSYLHPEAIDFSSNVSPLGPGERVIKAIEENAGNIFRYPSGGEKLRGIIAERHELKQENIALGNGSSELIKNFCEAFIDRGERVLIAGPTFSEYDYFSRLRGAEVQYTGLPENLVVDAGAFTENNFKAIFICHPNNPSSHIFTNIDSLLEKSSALVFVDEAYIEFSEIESFSELVKNYKNLFVLRSLTKFYSMPGLRIGYALSCRENIERVKSYQPPWNVNTLALCAAEAALKDESFVKESKEFFRIEREFLFRKLSEVDGLQVRPSYTNFFLLKLKIPAKKAKDTLLRKGILVRDCSSFGIENYIRVCIRKREENLKLLEAMEELNAAAGKDES